MADADFVADGCLTFRQQAFYRTMARYLHEADHGRGRKCAPPAHVVGEQLTVDRSLEPRLESGVDPLNRIHEIDCL